MRRGLLAAVLIGTLVLGLPSIANAAVSPSMHSHPNRGVPGVSTPYPCGPTTGYSCTPGYTGSNATGWAWSYYGCPKFASGCAAGTPHNCTLYAAFELMQQGVTLNWYDNANRWAIQAAAHGATVDQTPAVGAIAQWNLVTGEPGHVAVVIASDSGGITLRMDDYYTSSPWPVGYTAEVHITPSSPAWPDNFIHFTPPDPNAALKAAAKDHIVTVTPTKTSYYYDGTTLRWIQTTASYYCLVAQGATVYKVNTQQEANALGTGQPWETNTCLGKIITVSANGTSYYYDLAGVLHWIPDANTYTCLIGRGKTVLTVSTQAEANVLGNGQPWQPECLAPSQVANHIVRDSASGTSYFVSSGGIWHWIPDGPTYDCLVGKGYGVIGSNIPEMNSLLLSKKGSTMPNLCPSPPTVTTTPTTTTSPSPPPVTGPTSCTQPPTITDFRSAGFVPLQGFGGYWGANFWVTFDAFGGEGSVTVGNTSGTGGRVFAPGTEIFTSGGGGGRPGDSGTSDTAHATVTTDCGTATTSLAYTYPAQPPG